MDRIAGAGNDRQGGMGSTQFLDQLLGQHVLVHGQDDGGTIGHAQLV